MKTALFSFCPSRAFSRIRASNTAAGKPGGTECRPYRSHPFYALKNRMEIPVCFFSRENSEKIVRVAPRATRVNREAIDSLRFA